MTRPYRRPASVRVFTPEERAAWTVANPEALSSTPDLRSAGAERIPAPPKQRDLVPPAPGGWSRWSKRGGIIALPPKAPLPKRIVKLKRKDRMNKLADKTACEARLAAPWSLYVSVKEGGH